MTSRQVPRSTALRLFAVVAGAALVCDIVSKMLVVRFLTPADPVPVLGPVLQLYLIRNPGAAFSIGEKFTWVFTLLAAVVLAAIARFVLPGLRNRGWAVALGLVCAGIAGNLIDRLVREPGFARGHVVDFLRLPFWPIFNVADMCVVVGAGLVMVIWVVRGVGHDGVLERDRRTSDSPGETTSGAGLGGTSDTRSADDHE